VPLKSATSMRLLILGASGAVGTEVLAQALLEPRFSEVIAPTRRALPIVAKQLENPQLDFAKLDAHSAFWQVDAVICALGTTIKIAGSPVAFAAIDRDLPLAIARYTRAAGATRWALTSSLGASKSGNFYLRTKAETEAGLSDLAFPVLTIVRPSLINTERAHARIGETLGLIAARCLQPLIPKRYRAVTPKKIAKALIAGVLRNTNGTQVIESEQLWAQSDDAL
jgi:uncharacterized protein YbjT (DUF2867 family)